MRSRKKTPLRKNIDKSQLNRAGELIIYNITGADTRTKETLPKCLFYLNNTIMPPKTSKKLLMLQLMILKKNQ